MSELEIKQILGDNSLTSREKYFRLYGEYVHRNKALRHLKNLYKQYEVNLNKELFINPVSITMNEDGSQVSECTLSGDSSNFNNPEFLLRAHGYDPELYKLVSARSSVWDSQTPEGPTKMCSSRITVKPIKNDTNIEALVNKAVSQIKANSIAIDKSIVTTEDNTIEVCLPDLHIGLTDRYGRHLSEEVYFKLANIIDLIEKNPRCDEVVISFLGDIFHYDTAAKTTTSGTSQESNMPFEQMYIFANQVLYKFLVDVLELNRLVKVMYVPGNHDTVLGYTLMYTLQQLLKDYPIEFNISQEPRKFILIKNNLVGYTHGNMPVKNIVQWLYNDAKHVISQATNIEVHAGHLHTEKTFTEGIVKMRYLPTTCGISPWEKSQGYSHISNIEVFTWSNKGLETINYF